MTGFRERVAKLGSRASRPFYHLLDRLFVPLDRGFVRRSSNIRRIPHESHRRGGKYSYAEWGHVIGIFQTLLFHWLPKKQGNRVLDVGCGTGLLAIACEPFLRPGGRYTGIDVREPDIDYCQRHYDPDTFEFVRLEVRNAAYAVHESAERVEWPLESESFDVVTALSVWTHFSEEDSNFYLREVARVLRPGGRGILTFFVLDDLYRQGVSQRGPGPGRYHPTPQKHWIFDQPSYGSDSWFHTAWARVPETAIGVKEEALRASIADAGLKVLQAYAGNWKEVPGVFFQDVLVLEKPGGA